jgi:FAD/FMN-containing dehydrogenase
MNENASDPRAALAAIASAIGPANLLTADADRTSYEIDWRGRFRGRALAVARPGSTGEVARVVDICKRNRVAIVPQGGNTGLVGAGMPDLTGRQLVLSLGRMNKVRAIDTAGNTMTVEAGCVLTDLHAKAAEADRFLPIDLGAQGSCMIGGNISTNAGGTRVLRYGNTRELVLGLEVVLPDGRVLDGLKSLRKDNTGYDLKQLFIGAEGTLGIITAAVVRLFSRPKVTLSAMAALPGPAAAVELLAHMRAGAGDRVSAFEIMSGPYVELVLKHIDGLRRPLAGPSPFYVMIELGDTDAGADLADLAERLLGKALDKGLVTDATLSASEAQAADIWRIRHSVSEAVKREGLTISHDTSVPVRHVPKFVEMSERELRRQFPDALVLQVGHIGDGNVHVVAVFPREGYPDPDAFERHAKAVNAVVQDATAAFGGSISAEHGIGTAHKERLPLYKSALELEIMGKIKTLLDPEGLMNPGKIFG